MKKLFFSILLFLFCFSLKSLALDFSSDTSFASTSISEALSADGDFSHTVSKDRPKPIWYIQLSVTKTRTTDINGNSIIDDTSEVNFGGGITKKHEYDYGGGLTFANTPQENLRDLGPNFYYTFKAPAGEKVGQFTPEKTLKLSVGDLVYVQTFSTTFIGRNGQPRPLSGSSTINQLYPKIEGSIDVSEPLNLRASYTYYFYNRNVSEFLQNLDSPRAVAVGIYGLSNAVSSFNTDLKEFDVTWLPWDLWESDTTITESTSAVDSSASWTFKEAVLYDLTDKWKMGLGLEYLGSTALTDRVLTVAVKYSPE